MNKYLYPIYKSNLKPWIKYWLFKHLSEEGESELKVITLSSGKLTKVDKTKPLSVKEYYGNTVQDGTPTPETPIEVQTISGDNEIYIGSNTLKLDLKSKNLLNPYDIQNLSDNGITATINPDNSVTLNGTATANADIYYIGYFNRYDSLNVEAGNYTLSGIIDGSGTSYMLYAVQNRSGSLSYYQNYDSSTNRTISIQNGDKFRIFLRIISGQVLNNLKLYPQLEKGDTATTYEPYYNIELCKIGDYEDKIYKENDKWYIEKNIAKKVFSGSSSEGTWTTASAGYYQCSAGLGSISSAGALCDHYVYGELNVVNNFTITTNAFRVNDSTDTLTNYKTWLASNNVILYYVSNTPTTTEISSGTTLYSQLEALGNVTVSSSTVMISNDSEIPFEMKIEYYGR